MEPEDGSIITEEMAKDRISDSLPVESELSFEPVSWIWSFCIYKNSIIFAFIGHIFVGNYGWWIQSRVIMSSSSEIWYSDELFELW